MQGRALFLLFTGFLAGAALTWALLPAGVPTAGGSSDATALLGGGAAADRPGVLLWGRAGAEGEAGTPAVKEDEPPPPEFEPGELEELARSVKALPLEGTEALRGWLALANLHAMTGNAQALEADCVAALRAGADADDILSALRIMPSDVAGEILGRLVEAHPEGEWPAMALADLYIGGGDAERAVPLLEAGILEGGKKARRYAERYLELDLQRAVAFLGELLRIEKLPEGGLASWITTFLLKRKELGLARPFLDHVLRETPFDDGVLKALLDVDRRAALRHAEWRVAENPRDLEGWAFLASMRVEADDPSGAFEAYRSAASIRVEVGYLRGMLNTDTERALPEIEKLTRETKNDEELGTLADAYILNGHPEQALESYLRANERDPTDWQWLRAMVRLDPARSRDVLAEHIGEERSSKNDEVVGAYANALLRTGDKESAYDLYLLAMEKDNDDYEWVMGLARADPKRAVPVLEKHLGAKPENPHRLGALGLACAHGGDKERGLSLLEEAVQAKPSSHWPAELARVAPEVGLTVMRSAVDASPNDDDVWGSLGEVYLALGRDDDARAAFVRARELDPDDWRWRLELGLLQ